MRLFLRTLVAAFFLSFGQAYASLPLLAAEEPQKFRSVESRHLENLFRLTPHLLSGGSPLTREAFHELQTLGVGLIISVDGARPSVELAREFGIGYLHVPMGYNGELGTNAHRLVKAALTSSKPVYIHCHHGKHRGPAAAALIAKTMESWDDQQVSNWLQAAGTAKEYGGLFRMAHEYLPPTAAELQQIPSDLPEAVEPSGILQAMVKLDLHWQNLREIRRAGFNPPAEHPQLRPVEEAFLLKEIYREMQRDPESEKKGNPFLLLLKEAEENADALARAFRSYDLSSRPPSVTLEPLWKRAAELCASCHKQFRN
jgi:rhodanese-related sulfurtransferase